ncbi:Carbonic anhydrase [Operophtera brumata]|uniref:Carbonic anhydrase n=1 Tax=Operophtera brumata TaxID=104452 RepID=A0A0L7LL50_OPEBR|nr:Carbonic anhydrase [Operophtera brumata]
MDPVTVRRPLIVGDSTFDYRPTSWPGMLLNNQNKKVRYQLINYERPVSIYDNVTDRFLWHDTDAILAVGQPPRPVAAFDKATIAIGHHHGASRVGSY